MPEGNEHHSRIAVTMPVFPRRIDKLLHLPLGQVFARSILGVCLPHWCNCAHYGCWRNQCQVSKCPHIPLLRLDDYAYMIPFMHSCKPLIQPSTSFAE